jgi:hypothetical protein
MKQAIHPNRSVLAQARLARITLATLLVLSLPAHAAEWFVSTTGSDGSGNGSIGAPFRTLAHVLNPGNAIVEAGDTVTLRGPEGNNVYEECDVRLRVPLTLRSHPGEWAHIYCDIANENTVTVQIDPGASGSTLSRLELSGGFFYALFLQTWWDSGGNPDGTGASDITVEDCVIHDSGRDAIKITPKSEDVTIRRCEIYNSGRIYPPGTPVSSMNAEGIDNVNGSRMRVEDSYVHDIATNGVYFKGGAADVIVQRNRIERTGNGGIMVGFDTSPEFFDLTLNPDYYEAVRGVVRNNIIRDTGLAGIGLYAAQDALIANNTLINTAINGHAGIYFGITFQDWDPEAGRPASVNPRIVNNIVLQDEGDCAGIRWADEIEPGGLFALVGDPGTDWNWFHSSAGPCNFVDRRPGSSIVSGGSFTQWQAEQGTDANSREAALTLSPDGHLPAASPAIDQGLALVEVTDDFDRQPRDAAFDVGADEYAGDAIFLDGFDSDSP